MMAFKDCQEKILQTSIWNVKKVTTNHTADSVSFTGGTSKAGEVRQAARVASVVVQSD
jgi:hypothetical protein